MVSKRSWSNLPSSADGSDSEPDYVGPSFVSGKSSSRYVEVSSDNIDSDLDEVVKHVVPITPPAPETEAAIIANSEMISRQIEVQYVSRCFFTGGHNSATQMHFMDEVIDSNPGYAHIATAEVSPKKTPAVFVRDERDRYHLRSESSYATHNNCLCEELIVEGNYEGLQDPYKNTVVEKLPAECHMSDLGCEMSLLKSVPSRDFDDNCWPFDTKGTYGYGSAIWPKEGAPGDDSGSELSAVKDLFTKPQMLLSRRTSTPAAALSHDRMNLLKNDTKGSDHHCSCAISCCVQTACNKGHRFVNYAMCPRERSCFRCCDGRVRPCRSMLAAEKINNETNKTGIECFLYGVIFGIILCLLALEIKLIV